MQDYPIQTLKGVGKKRAELFSRLGVESAYALLRFYPRTYEDWSQVKTIGEAPLGDSCCVRATCVSPVQERYIRKGMTLYTTMASDGTDTLKITIFNNKYLAGKLETGKSYLFFGKVGGSFLQKEMTSPNIEPAGTGARIRPIYRQTEGLNTHAIEKHVKAALDGLADTITEPLPAGLIKQYDLMPLGDALRQVHFPDSHAMLLRAQNRLAFEEMLYFQLGLMQLKGRNRKQTAYQLAEDATEAFYQMLPFTPTGAQSRTIAEAIEDMKQPIPMSRLVQGDVGAGKTAVAAALMFSAAKNGWQSAMMAPTEILAEQHFQSLKTLFANSGLEIDLLTGSLTAAQKRNVKERLETGVTDIVVGTQALIQKDVAFRALALVIADEQHRFGVKQRSELAGKGKNPHLLIMSATPIPRTLSLIVYGDLDVSVLDELPPGRQPIETYRVTTNYHKRIYTFIRKAIDEGRQAYIVCPLVEQGETEDLTSANEYAETLRARPEFKGCQIGLLHGKMRPSEKEAVMRAFQQNELQILVSTTVIEVGVDVPNATIMCIENAERFGLSQLHQLRGRVGRGKHASTCILISDAQGESSLARLDTMCRTSDGFEIANEDLKLRGPGDFFGQRQHGLPQMQIANMLSDLDMLREAQDCAKQIIDADPDLKAAKYKGLKAGVTTLFEQSDGNMFN